MKPCLPISHETEKIALEEVSERLKSVFISLVQSNKQTLLFIDHIHRFLGAQPAIDVANFLVPLLARGQIRLIGACQLSQFQQYIEHSIAFHRRFQEVFMPDT
jgi:ATP-dependent Clp protease ATP-binding subunit ClpA